MYIIIIITAVGVTANVLWYRVILLIELECMMMIIIIIIFTTSGKRVCMYIYIYIQYISDEHERIIRFIGSCSKINELTMDRPAALVPSSCSR